MNIKYVYIHGWKRNVLLLTVMDIYTHKVIIHLLKPRVREGGVLVLPSLILLEYKAEGMTIRNDNGSQFIDRAFRQYLRDQGISQKFRRVANHENNAYIEALYSNLQREVIDQFEFDSIYHA